MSNFIIPQSGKQYRIVNRKNKFLLSLSDSQAKVGGGPGNGGEWYWEINVTDSFPEEKRFNAMIFNRKTNRYLSTVSKDGNNKVMCWGYSDTLRKHWEFLWDESQSMFRIINLSRQGVGVGTKYMGSNADSRLVYVGGDLISDEYVWEIYQDFPPV